MIIDSHQHVMLPTKLQIQKMNEAGVDKTILFPTTPHVEKAINLSEVNEEMRILFKLLSGDTTFNERIKSIEKANAELLCVIENNPDKFLGFGQVPFGLTEIQNAQWIDKNIRSKGLSGIGEFTPGTEEIMSSLEVVFKSLLNFKRLPIWVHTFHPVTLSSLKILMGFCKKYPSVPVIFGHMGGYNWITLLEFVKTAPNAYVDLSGAFSAFAVKIALSECPTKCLFSSDAPFGEPILNRQLIEYVSPNAEITKMVLGDNIQNLLF